MAMEQVSSHMFMEREKERDGAMEREGLREREGEREEELRKEFGLSACLSTV